MVSKEFMDYFKFDEADLSASKTGQLTDKQKMGLSKDVKSGRTRGIISDLFFLGIASIFPIAFFGICLFGGNCKTDSGVGALLA